MLYTILSEIIYFIDPSGLYKNIYCHHTFYLNHVISRILISNEILLIMHIIVFLFISFQLTAMSHTVTITRTTATTSSSPLFVNSGYLGTLPGLLKLAQLVRNKIFSNLIISLSLSPTLQN